MFRVLIINGPNLNLLGTREPEHYGSARLADILDQLRLQAEMLGVGLSDFQSNAEHELIGQVQQAPSQCIDFIVVNPAALTHTSVSLRDALQAISIPFIEVHLSNIYAREAFRKKSYFSDIAVGVISGLGPVGYELALRAAVNFLQKVKK